MEAKTLKSAKPDRPLVTFALIAYNAEAFVKEAVEGAFAQSYTPLEIILSDDCSVDGTFGIMEELVDGYRGKHHVILNRNESNLGIGNHINLVMELANGEYVVAAAGDDISLPGRTECLIESFCKNKGVVTAFSDFIEIDECGREKRVVSARPPERYTELPEMCRHMFRGVTGATTAWHRSVFDAFGPMREGIVFEDRVIAFRAALLGDMLHVPKALVRYRRHDENTVSMFHFTSNNAMRARMQCFRDVYLNNIRDLERFAEKDDLSQKIFVCCRNIMRRELRKLNGYIKFLSGRTATRYAGLIQVILNGGNPWYVLRKYHNLSTYGD